MNKHLSEIASGSSSKGERRCNAIRPPVQWPEGVAKKVELFCAAVANAGLLLVQGQPDPAHDGLRPSPCLGRITTAQDHEVIRIRHDFRSELLALPLHAP